MAVKVSSSPSSKHHLNPYARPYTKTPPVYFVHPLTPLRYYYPHFQYSTYHSNENTDDQPKQMAKNMYVQRLDHNRRFLPPRQRPRQVWKPKLGNEAAKKVHVDAPVASATASFVQDVDETQKTSVMMRNIPNQYSRDELMEFLDKCCAEHKLEYDFFYLPIDFRRHQNKGYAFINFTKPPYAKMFQKMMTGYKWGFTQLGDKFFTSRKTCEITWAKLQGKNELVRHFKGSKFPCYLKHYLPVELSPPSNGDASLSTLTIVGRYWDSA
ncbi:RRM domain-containing protein [Heracleum sosnowskyi]|uniref:RRM domain-containing protein n=1 Tax=Heracleum sosnowskyi TaxID=360622 RepID=A0AAD8M6T5_9APIA|nr:RRM domain-containing protein [Heracleum sosnowskyi]